MAPDSSTLAWRVPRTEEPGRLQSMGSLRVGHNWAPSLSLSTFMHWRRKWQPTPVFLPGESQGRGEPGGLPSMGSYRVGHDWSDLAAAAAATPRGLWRWYTMHWREGKKGEGDIEPRAPQLQTCEWKHHLGNVFSIPSHPSRCHGNQLSLSYISGPHNHEE